MTDKDEADETKEATLSETDERLISRIVLLSQVFQEKSRDKKASADRRTLGSALKEPTVLAAIVTVLIGGVVATLITGIIQWRAGLREFEQAQAAREREFNQTWLKARGDQALVSYKEYLDQERMLITRAYSGIGSCISATDRLVGLTKDDWRYDFRDRDTVEKQKQEIIDNYNLTGAKWHREGPEIGLLFGYYHPGEKDIPKSWESVERGVKDYLKCGRNWYDIYVRATKPPSDDEVSKACAVEKEILLAELKNLTVDLEAGRQYSWSGWDSPDQLKNALGIKSR